ncbi:MAG TPA: hypothetical protein VKQ36_05150 [Ktedonobacterales bacterium]|nr:hypothetical protein [Ktedonobacterales bacterium]
MTTSQQLIAPLIMRDQRIALILGDRVRWRAASGYLFAPLELPGGAREADETPAHAVSRLAQHWLGCEADVFPSQHMYGVSSKHAIDRLTPTPDDEPLPLLKLERLAPIEADSSAAYTEASVMRRVVVRVYLAQLCGEPGPAAHTTGLLWLTPHVLRRVTRGMTLADVLALEDQVSWQAASGFPFTEDDRACVLLYTPAEYGERHLLRVEAKYGALALWP